MHGLQQCIVHSGGWECGYKLNDQPVREQVTASAELMYMYMYVFCSRVMEYTLYGSVTDLKKT